MKNNVVITGATSPVGISIIEAMPREYNITAIIRLNSKNKYRLQNYVNVTIIECNLDNLKSLGKYEIETDIFYHIAWDGTSKQDRDDLCLQLKNIKYAIDAAYLAKQWNTKTFVGCGSQAEYGCVYGTIDEQTPVNPNTPYGIAKYCTYKFLEQYFKKEKINFKWGRIFSAYGKYDGSSTLIMTLIECLQNNDVMKLTKCEQTWNYINYIDVGRAFYLMGIKGKSGVYCIAGKQTETLRFFVETVCKVMNKKSIIDFGAIPYNENQVMNLSVDVSKLEKELDFIEEITFEKGIKLLNVDENGK